MPYHITPYSYEQAKKIGVIIKPSKHQGKKIDVFDKNEKFICSIGDTAYRDYPTYLETEGKKYADERRKLFRLRHSKSLHLKGTPGWYAAKLLW